MGLIDALVPAEELLDRAVERARFLGGLSGAAYAAIKLRSRAAAHRAVRPGPRPRSLPRLLVLARTRAFRIRDMVARLKSKG